MRHLGAERATKWRGGAVRQEPQMTTPPRQAAVWRSGHRFGQFVPLEMTVCCLPASSSRAEEPAGMVAKTLGSNETQSREISCHHGLATFRSEISPLRSATVEMTVAVSSRAEEHIGMGGKNLNLLNSMNPGRGAAHPAAPFRLAALATHPREGGGQVTWRRRTLPSKLVVYGWRGTAKPPKAAL